MGSTYTDVYRGRRRVYDRLSGPGHRYTHERGPGWLTTDGSDGTNVYVVQGRWYVSVRRSGLRTWTRARSVAGGGGVLMDVSPGRRYVYGRRLVHMWWSGPGAVTDGIRER